DCSATSADSSATRAGVSSSRRLRAMASASSSCFLKMYAALGEKPASGSLRRIFSPWLRLDSTAQGGTPYPVPLRALGGGATRGATTRPLATRAGEESVG